MVLFRGWHTCQFNYTNTFAQADLKEEIYIEPPKGFSSMLDKDMVLHLFKSLYGLKQAPKTFFDKLKAGLLEHGFTQLAIDPCLFLKKDLVCIVYVNDTILEGPNKEALEKEF